MLALSKVDVTSPKPAVLVMVPTHELATQIEKEFLRFGKYSNLSYASFYGQGSTVAQDRALLERTPPHIVIGTPGRLSQLVRESYLNMRNVQTFIVDECDRVHDGDSMQRAMQEVFTKTPRNKQVLMFTATLSPSARQTCRKYTNNVGLSPSPRWCQRTRVFTRRVAHRDFGGS